MHACSEELTQSGFPAQSPEPVHPDSEPDPVTAESRQGSVKAFQKPAQPQCAQLRAPQTLSQLWLLHPTSPYNRGCSMHALAFQVFRQPNLDFVMTPSMG